MFTHAWSWALHFSQKKHDIYAPRSTQAKEKLFALTEINSIIFSSSIRDLSEDSTHDLSCGHHWWKGRVHGCTFLGNKLDCYSFKLEFIPAVGHIKKIPVSSPDSPLSPPSCFIIALFCFFVGTWRLLFTISFPGVGGKPSLTWFLWWLVKTRLCVKMHLPAKQWLNWIWK